MRSTIRNIQRPSRRVTRAVAVGISATLAAGLLAACSSDDDDDNGGSGGGDGQEEITLKVGVFGQFGFEEAGLYDEYMELNPHITIEQESITDSGDYATQLRTRLTSSSGLLDIQAIEVGNIAEMTTDLSDTWVDFNEYPDVDSSHFHDFKNAQATDADGRLIGLGTDIGPTGICYRTDFFEQAGLPTDREEVTALFAGGWEDYLSVGEDFAADGPEGVAFMDSAGGIFNAVVSAYEERYYSADGEVAYQDTEAVATGWDLATRASDAGLSSGLEQFSDDWNRAMANGDFATLPACPAWMLGYIQSQGGDASTDVWDVAQSPTPSNWGGSFVGVPEAGDNKEEAVKLAAWLTAPEQQIKFFTERAAFPSSAAAEGVPSTVIGPFDNVIQTQITNGLLALEQDDGLTPDDAWDNVVAELDNALAQ